MAKIYFFILKFKKKEILIIILLLNFKIVISNIYLIMTNKNVDIELFKG